MPQWTSRPRIAGAAFTTKCPAINVEFTYYRALTRDVLFSAPPFNPSSGQANQLRNLGRYVKEGLPIGYLPGTRIDLTKVDEEGNLTSDAFTSNAFWATDAEPLWLAEPELDALEPPLAARHRRLPVGGRSDQPGRALPPPQRPGHLRRTGTEPNYASWAARAWKGQWLAGNISSTQMGTS